MELINLASEAFNYWRNFSETEILQSILILLPIIVVYIRLYYSIPRCFLYIQSLIALLSFLIVAFDALNHLRYILHNIIFHFNFRCPQFAFQCAYGACVDSSAECNSVIDCVDGSDENTAKCSKVTNAKTCGYDKLIHCLNIFLRVIFLLFY